MKNRKLYLGLIFVLLAVVVYLLTIIIEDEGIALGKVAVRPEDRPIEWYEVISTDINGEHLILEVDGVEIKFNKYHLYMGNDMNVMIPVAIFPQVFQCAINYLSDTYIQLQKGKTVVEIESDMNVVYVNDAAIELGNGMKVVDGEYYVNSKVMEKGFGYSYNWKSSNNTLQLADGSVESYLPSRYNYGEVGRLPDIKNQGSLSTCWAFAAISAVESTILPEDKLSLSVDNMVGNNGYSSTAHEGGDYTRAIAYLTSWTGPVLESEDVYGDGIINKQATAKKHVQEAQILESKNIEAIKRAVFLQGGVESSLYTSMSKAGQTSWYYNDKTSAYCYIGTQKPNHDVVIVGWDDNYSKDNFSVHLEADGAFICANSWGKEFGDNGLFYVSYYDSNIGIHSVAYTSVENSDNYDNIYQSDLCGWVGQLGYEEESAYFANAYTAKSDEEVKAVGFYAIGKNTSYEIYVVEDFTDASSLNKRRMLQSGSFKNAGYYTVDLDTPVIMDAGTKYAIVVKITTPDVGRPIAIEYRAGKSTQDVILDDGEGYISYLGRVWENVEASKNCNICLKMYTDNIE